MRKKGRSFLTVMGIAVGTAAVIIISSISQCGAAAVSTELESLGVGGLSISADTSLGADSVPLSDRELKLISDFSYVDKAMPLIFQTASVSCGGKESPALLWGIDNNADEIISLRLMYGRFINKGDIAADSRVCLADESFAEDNFGYANIIGRKISVLCDGSYEEFEVVGVIKTGSGLLQNMMGSYIPTFMYFPYTTMQELYSMSGFHRIAVRLEDGADPDAAGEKLTKALSSEAGLEDGYISESMAKQKDSLSEILNIVTVILSAVGGISLLVAGLGIMNVMLVSVGEKKREIGIKKAIGAGRGDILSEFLAEALMLTLSGGALGAVLGIAVSFAGSFIFGATLELRYDIIVFTLAFSVAAGVIFGVYPAYKAAKLKPVDALRNY